MIQLGFFYLRHKNLPLQQGVCGLFRSRYVIIVSSKVLAGRKIHFQGVWLVFFRQDFQFCLQAGQKKQKKERAEA